MVNCSTKLNFHNLQNTRDLGNIRTLRGETILPGKLFRSGHLYFADEEDQKQLSALHLKRIYDFRSGPERQEKPDPTLQNVQNLHLPILEDPAPGISRDNRSAQMTTDLLLQNTLKDPGFGRRYMADTYLQFIRNPYSRKQFASFLAGVCGCEEGGVLWHCTAGKDRAGFATVLLLEILGVHRDDILEDYLYTNDCIAKEIDQLLSMLSRKLELQGGEDLIRDFFEVREEYLTAVWNLVDTEYGSMESYLKNGLFLTETHLMTLRSRYLV